MVLGTAGVYSRLPAVAAGSQVPAASSPGDEGADSRRKHGSAQLTSSSASVGRHKTVRISHKTTCVVYTCSMQLTVSALQLGGRHHDELAVLMEDGPDGLLLLGAQFRRVALVLAALYTHTTHAHS